MNHSNKYLVQFSGLGLGKHGFEWLLDKQFFDDFENEDITGASLKATLELEKESRLMNLSIDIMGTIETICDHCGDPLSLPISCHNELIARFADETDLTGDEVIYLSNAEHLLDLRQYLYEFTVLAIPARKSHESGKCNPVIEQFLIQQAPDNEMQKDPRWEALEKYRK